MKLTITQKRSVRNGRSESDEGNTNSTDQDRSEGRDVDRDVDRDEGKDEDRSEEDRDEDRAADDKKQLPNIFSFLFI